MIAIDTNVLVYAVDAAEPDKQAKAIALLSVLSKKPDPLVVPWQVAGEIGRALCREGV